MMFQPIGIKIYIFLAIIIYIRLVLGWFLVSKFAGNGDLRDNQRQTEK